MVVGTGAHRYRVVPGWGMGGGRRFGGVLPGVCTDSDGVVYITRRSPPAILVHGSDGAYRGEWGSGVLSNPHHISWDGGSLWVTDTKDHTVRQFSREGELLLVLGTPGITGAEGEPFNRPTKAWVTPAGELYVSDGYGQARVHRFRADGELFLSWGAPGRGAGEFALPHAVAVGPDGVVYVCDRENGRILLFDERGAPCGELRHDLWPGVQWPNDVWIGGDGVLYVAEAGHRISIWRRTVEAPPSPVKSPANVFELLARWGDTGGEPGQFLDCPHALWVDAEGSIYVTEVPNHPDRVQKFQRL